MTASPDRAPVRAGHAPAHAGRARRRPEARADRWLPALRRGHRPLLAAPVAPGDVTTSGKVTPADAASAVLVVACAVRLLRDRAAAADRRPRPPCSARPWSASRSPRSPRPTRRERWPDSSATPSCSCWCPPRWCCCCATAGTSRVVAGAVVAARPRPGRGRRRGSTLTGTGASYMGEDIRAVGTFGPSDVMGMATVVAYGLVVAPSRYALARRPRPARLRIGGLCCAALLAGRRSRCPSAAARGSPRPSRVHRR